MAGEVSNRGRGRRRRLELVGGARTNVEGRWRISPSEWIEGDSKETKQMRVGGWIGRDRDVGEGSLVVVVVVKVVDGLRKQQKIDLQHRRQMRATIPE